MFKHRTIVPILVIAALALALALVPVLSVGASAPASSVEPVVVSGNPTCTSLGYDFGFKINANPAGGTYFLINGTQNGDLTELESGTPSDSSNSVTVTYIDGITFNWSATLGIDAVIAKGSDAANVYYYDPESMGDSGLHPPANASGGYATISHVSFCYDYEVDVMKGADTTFKRTWNWTIDKLVDPATWDLFVGDSGTSTYTVSATKTGHTDSDWAVSGSITIENNTPFDATLTGVSDSITGGINPPVDCGVAFPYVLPAGNPLVCSYSSALPDDTSRTNTATVTTSGTVGGGEATADVTFGDPTTTVNDSINVDDSNGGSWLFSGSGFVNYDKTFTCGADEGTHGNTATIRETGQSSSASVTVKCYSPTVDKTASGTFDRVYKWRIDKTADQPAEGEDAIVVSLGQTVIVDYSITIGLDTDKYPDGGYDREGYEVTGTITIGNPHPSQSLDVSLNDVLSDGTSAMINCGSGPVLSPVQLTLAPGSTVCTYVANPGGEVENNKAIVSWNTLYSVSHTEPVGEFTLDDTIDECVELFDTNFISADNVEGHFVDEPVCVEALDPDSLSLTIDYPAGSQVMVGPYEECGPKDDLYNKAWFITNDRELEGFDEVTIPVMVPCEGGCTLTPGYWKTHSEYGPAPYDNTWAMLANGADTPFFLSGQSYYEVLWTSPKGGNAYYILAHAYIAAELNFLNEADPSAAQVAFDEATTLFETYTPDEIADMKGKNGKEIRDQFISLAEVLDEYNNGLIGPGHCSEDGCSAPEFEE